MKGKIIAILIMINLILVGVIYNFISKENVNNKKQIIKEMTETEYEDYIKSLNASHEDFANYIQESKTKIASAITDMGVETSEEATLETMANNIRSISDNGNITLLSDAYTSGNITLNDKLSNYKYIFIICGHKNNDSSYDSKLIPINFFEMGMPHYLNALLISDAYNKDNRACYKYIDDTTVTLTNNTSYLRTFIYGVN